MADIDIKQSCQQLASSLGFCSCGIADVSAGPELAELAQWVACGYHGDMAYMGRDNRGNIQALYPWANSAVVCAMQVGEPMFTCARYAQGQDYHLVMTERLTTISEALCREYSADTKVCVDTAPILERELARRSGIGWIGKNGMLITPEYGSYVMIGVILTSLEMPFDEAITPKCGKCTKCITACPNQAIVAPYKLDSAKCLSYLTLENKRSIDPRLWPVDHRTLFGCDICQQCCPYNTAHSMHPHRGEASPVEEMKGLQSSWGIDELVELLDQRSLDVFRDNRALSRVKFLHILRNTVVASVRNHDCPISLRKLVLCCYADTIINEEAELLWDLVRLIDDSVQ